MESISFELYHDNPDAIFQEYKEWRDAIEHNYFFLARSNSDIEELKNMYKSLKRISIVVEEEFRNKALHLLHLCRSSIFSFVFLVRSECCVKYFKH